jgi:predicted nuclease of predicted toxin-antitoxin system
MRLLVDMNLTPRWVSRLRAGGHDALHWSEAGHHAATDHEIFEYARVHRRLLLSNDLDFPRLLAHTRQSGPSVVILRGEPLTPEVRGSSLLRVLQDCETELLAGAILSLDWSGRARFRLLPL